MLKEKPKVSKRGRKAVETSQYVEQSEAKIKIWEDQLKLMKAPCAKNSL